MNSAHEARGEDVLERDVAGTGRPVQLVPGRDDERRQEQPVEPWPQRDHRASPRRRRRSLRASGAVTRPLACTIAGSGSRMSNVPSTAPRADLPQRAAQGRALLPRGAQVRGGDHPAAAVVLRARAHGPLLAAQHVEVGDARKVHAAGARQPVPLPEPGIHLHQLEAPVARVQPELGLRDAVVAERREQRECLLDDVLAPARLAHAAGAEAARHLQELAPAEQPERRAGGIRVRAHRPQRRVVARDHLLQQRLAVGGAAPGLEQLGRRLADDHGPPEAPLERDRIAGLDDRRVGERGRGRDAPRPRCRPRT